MQHAQQSKQWCTAAVSCEMQKSTGVTAATGKADVSCRATAAAKLHAACTAIQPVVDLGHSLTERCLLTLAERSEACRANHSTGAAQHGFLPAVNLRPEAVRHCNPMIVIPVLGLHKVYLLPSAGKQALKVGFVSASLGARCAAFAVNDHGRELRFLADAVSKGDHVVQV